MNIVSSVSEESKYTVVTDGRVQAVRTGLATVEKLIQEELKEYEDQEQHEVLAILGMMFPRLSGLRTTGGDVFLEDLVGILDVDFLMRIMNTDWSTYQKRISGLTSEELSLERSFLELRFSELQLEYLQKKNREEVQKVLF